MNFDPIIVAMVSAIQMLDHATEEEADPGFVVEVQQIMGDYLDELSGGDVREFREILLRIASERSSSDPLIAQYLQRLADGYASRELFMCLWEVNIHVPRSAGLLGLRWVTSEIRGHGCAAGARVGTHYAKAEE